MKLNRSTGLFCLALQLSMAQSPSDSVTNTASILQLLRGAKERAQKHGAHYVPVLSPLDTMLGSEGEAPVFDAAKIQAAGFPVVVWTVNNKVRMRELLARHVDGIISDRPDLLHEAVVQAKANAASDTERAYLERFDAEAHRGGRDLRPENTLPSFESGLDNLAATVETDTGVTKDGVSLISHEQFVNPQTCRAADGSEYRESNRVWIKDITMAEAQQRFICDKVFRGPQQKNDLALSPVAVAFAKERGLRNPYVPTSAGQLFEFVEYYAEFYRNGPGKSHPQAEDRWRNAAKVHFNLETKLTPQSTATEETQGPQAFIDALCGVIVKSKLEARADVQSFDFRTLTLAGEQFPKIKTVYLVESMRWRQAAH